MIVYLTKEASLKIRYFVRNCEQEISGLGRLKVERLPGGNRRMVVTDVEIFDQVVSDAHSTIDEDALAKFLFEKTKAGDNLAEWRVWWHSHAKMAVFFSGTDTGTIDASKEFPYLVSIVTNHAGEFKARLDIYDPARCTVDNIQVHVLEEENEDLELACLAEIEAKVRRQTVVSYYPGQGRVGFQPQGLPVSSQFLPPHGKVIDLNDENEYDLAEMGILVPKSKYRGKGKGKYSTRHRSQGISE